MNSASCHYFSLCIASHKRIEDQHWWLIGVCLFIHVPLSQFNLHSLNITAVFQFLDSTWTAYADSLENSTEPMLSKKWNTSERLLRDKAPPCVEKRKLKTKKLLYILAYFVLTSKKIKHYSHWASGEASACVHTTILARSDLSEWFAVPPSYLDSKAACIIFVYDAVFSELSSLPATRELELDFRWPPSIYLSI